MTATTATRQEPQEEEEAADVRLGDASLAAPFTAKSPSIACIADLLRQGRASLARAQQQGRRRRRRRRMEQQQQRRRQWTPACCCGTC